LLRCGKKLALSLLPLQMHGLIRFGVIPGSLDCCLFQTQAFLSIHAQVIAVTTRFNFLLLKCFSRIRDFLSGVQPKLGKTRDEKNIGSTGPVLLSSFR
jgi:hypothetical protein